MNPLKRFIDLFLFGNVYVAIGAACLIQSSTIQFGLSNRLTSYSALTFFATLFIYNLQRIFYKPQNNISLHSIRRKWIFENQPAIKFLSILGLAGVITFLFFTDPMVILYLSPLLLLTLSYFLPVVKLRKSPWFKLLTLSIVWTMVTAVVPALLANETITSFPVLLHIFVRFIFMLGICIPFDIRDMEIDKADKISTIPHILGEHITRWMAFTFMMLYIALIIVEHNVLMFDREVYYGLIISAFINTCLVLMTNSKRSEYFFVAALDGTMILQGLLLLLADNVF
ncbi:MAG: UbiA family prenyltransferase [Bacteroidetes bacterium]|nr:UbiA family prenyltransferase [Bacteroidota bacterium]